MTKLGEILQEEAQAEIEEVLTEAESKAKSLVRKAEQEASDREAAYRRKAEAELRVATDRAGGAAELLLSTALARARGHAMSSVKEKTLAFFENIVREPKYGDILAVLADEALKVIQEPEALVVHPDDEDKLSDWAAGKRLELRTDPELHLGVRVVASGGSRSVENSLPERLRRAWETLAPAVAQRLWD